MTTLGPQCVVSKSITDYTGVRKFVQCASGTRELPLIESASLRRGRYCAKAMFACSSFSPHSSYYQLSARVHSVYVLRRRYAKSLEAVRQAAAKVPTPGTAAPTSSPAPGKNFHSLSYTPKYNIVNMR